MKKNELKYCINGVYLLRNCNQLFEFIGKIKKFFKISQKISKKRSNVDYCHNEENVGK